MPIVPRYLSIKFNMATSERDEGTAVVIKYMIGAAKLASRY